MEGGTGCLLGRDVKRDLAMHVYISYLHRSAYMGRILPGCFSCRPDKPGSRLKRDNLYYAEFAKCPTGEIVPGRNIHM